MNHGVGEVQPDEVFPVPDDAAHGFLAHFGVVDAEPATPDAGHAEPDTADESAPAPGNSAEADAVHDHAPPGPGKTTRRAKCAAPADDTVGSPPQ